MQFSFGVECMWPVYILQATISGSLIVSVKWQLPHFVYRFNGSRLLWVPIYMGYSFGRCRLTLWAKNGKFTLSTGHGCQEGDWWYPSCKLLGMCLRNIFQSIFLIFIIHVRLYHRCVKFGWWKFGEFLVGRQFCQILAAPKFPSIWYLATCARVYIIRVSFHKCSLTYKQLTVPTGTTSYPCMHAWMISIQLGITDGHLDIALSRHGI